LCWFAAVLFALQFGWRSFLVDANHAVLFNRGDDYRVSVMSRKRIVRGSGGCAVVIVEHSAEFGSGAVAMRYEPRK
jgi:uncharacterized protein (AIM24 family)